MASFNTLSAIPFVFPTCDQLPIKNHESALQMETQLSVSYCQIEILFSYDYTVNHLALEIYTYDHYIG